VSGEISFNDLEKMNDNQVKQLKRNRMVTKASPPLPYKESKNYLDILSKSVIVEKPTNLRKSQQMDRNINFE